MRVAPWISVALLSFSILAAEPCEYNLSSENVEEECSVAYWGCGADCDCCDHLFGFCVKALPGGPPPMAPFLADPRKVGMSAGWRFNDDVIDPQHSGPVSFGDYAGLVRWCYPFGNCGAVDLGIEGNVWAIFQQCREAAPGSSPEPAPLVNADYYIGIPVFYTTGDWVFRFRLSHISSHIGDEFMLNNPGFHRKNPSSEYIDFFLSWQPNCNFRVYGGVGIIARSDVSFNFKRFYSEYGLEYYLPWLRWCIPKSNVQGRPFAAAHFRSREDNDFNFDGTFVFGYEWARCYCDYKRVRLYFEYHNGFSLEGQFSRERTNYTALVAYYGY